MVLKTAAEKRKRRPPDPFQSVPSATVHLRVPPNDCFPARGRDHQMTFQGADDLALVQATFHGTLDLLGYTPLEAHAGCVINLANQLPVDVRKVVADAILRGLSFSISAGPVVKDEEGNAVRNLTGVLIQRWPALVPPEAIERARVGELAPTAGGRLWLPGQPLGPGPGQL